MATKSDNIVEYQLEWLTLSRSECALSDETLTNHDPLFLANRCPKNYGHPGP